MSGGCNDNSQISGFSDCGDSGTSQWAAKQEMQVGENNRKSIQVGATNEPLKKDEEYDMEQQAGTKP